MSKFYSTAETAAMLGLSPKTIRNWINSGELHAVRTSPKGQYRVWEQDLLHLLHERTK